MATKEIETWAELKEVAAKLGHTSDRAALRYHLISHIVHTPEGQIFFKMLVEALGKADKLSGCPIKCLAMSGTPEFFILLGESYFDMQDILEKIKKGVLDDS